MIGRWRRAGLIAALCLAAAGCTPQVTFGDGPPKRVRVEFRDVAFSLEVPASLGAGRLDRDAVTGECAHEEHVWRRLPSDSSDDDELLFAGAATRGCPERQAVNGAFPTWATTDDLPEDAKPVDAPVGTAYRFSLRYTQCTNECYSTDYQVYFIEVSDGGEPRSFWLQAAHVDAGTLKQMVASIELA